MKRLGKPGAIEPTSIDKVTPGWKYGVNMPSAAVVMDIPKRWPWEKAECTHFRKRLHAGTMTRRCMDCGTVV